MTPEFSFNIKTTQFDENYLPADNSRATTNFANLARGEHRQQNLRTALSMMNHRFNDLASAENPHKDRYQVELEIISGEIEFAEDDSNQQFPLIEFLNVTILDQTTGERIPGIVGNSFSSYVRDFDFSIRLPAVNKNTTEFTVPDDFGDLHGKLFQLFIESGAYRERFESSPVICISVSSSKTYERTGFVHPVLGVEYRQEAFSLTDQYFGKMGLHVRYFMPPGGVAPLAFYFRGDLTEDYTDLQLMGTISTMETFQKIYRPEIYNANEVAQEIYRPTLDAQDFTKSPVVYDRVERDQLAVEQAKYTEELLVTPFGETLKQWAASYPAPVA